MRHDALFERILDVLGFIISEDSSVEKILANSAASDFTKHVPAFLCMVQEVEAKSSIYVMWKNVGLNEDGLQRIEITVTGPTTLMSHIISVEDDSEMLYEACRMIVAVYDHATMLPLMEN